MSDKERRKRMQKALDALHKKNQDAKAMELRAKKVAWWNKMKGGG